MMKYLYMAMIAFLTQGVLMAQDFSRETINFEYNRLPLKPFPEGTETFTVEVINHHEEKVKGMIESYEAEKDEAQAEVDKEHDAVKIINAIHGSSTKVRFVEKPYFPKLYEGAAVEDKINIEPLSRDQLGDVLIKVELQGLSFSKSMGTSGSSEAPTYYYKVSAKHEMKVSSYDGDGNLIDEWQVPGSNKSSKVNTKKFKSSEALEDYWKKSKSDVLSPLDQKVTEKNLKAANAKLNDVHGASVQKKPFKLVIVNDKKMDYSSYMQAYEAAFEGAVFYLEDEAKSIEKFNEAIALYEKELEESDVDNKKARINRKVTAATRYNCIALLIWCHEYDKARMHYVKLKMLDMSKYNRQMKQLKAFLEDQQARYEANQKS